MKDDGSDPESPVGRTLFLKFFFEACPPSVACAMSGSGADQHPVIDRQGFTVDKSGEADRTQGRGQQGQQLPRGPGPFIGCGEQVRRTSIMTLFSPLAIPWIFSEWVTPSSGP